MIIGCHLSTAKGFAAMGKTAVLIGANTFQFFTRNPRGGSAKAIDPVDIANLLELMKEHSFPCILAHAPYTLNPCSSEAKTREFALQAMTDDLERMEYTPHQFYNFHPGSHTGQGIETGIRLIIGQLNSVLQKKQTTTVLLETMAGKGTEVGSKFEELRQILDGVELKEKLGVCLDTCHVFDAGYDIVHDLDGVLSEFDSVIGLDRLKAIHLNDSKNPIGSRKDRHECIGKGYIGLEALIAVVKHPSLSHLPFYLETPNDPEGHGEEIALIKSCCEQNSDD